MNEPTDWQALARARQLDLPADTVARIVPSLDALLRAFQPLLAEIPHTTEPATILSEQAVTGE